MSIQLKHKCKLKWNNNFSFSIAYECTYVYVFYLLTSSDSLFGEWIT